MQVALSYTSLGVASAELDKRIAAADRMDTRRDDEQKDHREWTVGADHRLVRMEFIELCLDVLWDVPLEHLRQAASNYQAAIKAVRDEASLRWKRAADRVDSFARTFVVPAYIITLVFMLNLNLDDGKYAWIPGNNTLENFTSACLPPRSVGADGVCRYSPEEQYQGIYAAFLTPSGLGNSLVAPSLILGYGLGYLFLYRVAVCKHIVKPKIKDVAATNRRATIDLFGATIDVTSVAAAFGLAEAPSPVSPAAVSLDDSAKSSGDADGRWPDGPVAKPSGTGRASGSAPPAGFDL